MAKILIVEDEHIVAWDIKETLEKIGHSVVDRVVSGAEAIRAATVAQPDLVLMDIRLQGEIDGIVAGNDIYHRLDIPIVYLTAHADELTLKRATHSNPFGYIVKPFQSHSLQTTVEIALQRHQLEVSAKLDRLSLTQTIDSIGSGIIVTDRQGAVTLMNPLAESLTGWKEAEAIGIEIDRIYRPIWETDGTTIENPSLRAMRLNQIIKSSDKCWLVAKDGNEVPICDTATPLLDAAGETIGSTLMFQDNTERVLARLDLEERQNQELSDFQLKFITQLQQETAEHQLALACIQVLNSVLQQLPTAMSEYEILAHGVQVLGTAIDADYCWVSIHDPQTATAAAIYEYAPEQRILPVSAIGRQIDIQIYPRFYRHLCQAQSWIDPPMAILPSVYANLLAPASQLLVCPIAVADDLHERERLWTIGEVGIVTTGKPTWLPSQTKLISQVFSYAIGLFRRSQLQLNPNNWQERSSEWLDTIDNDFTKMLGASLRMSHPAGATDAIAPTSEVDRYLHRQLLEYLQLVKSTWREQLNLVDAAIDFENYQLTPTAITTIAAVEFHGWLDRLVKNCQLVADRYHQNLSSEIITRDLPPTTSCNFPIFEAILMEVFANACKYAAPVRPIFMNIAIQDQQLILSIAAIAIKIPASSSMFQPFAHNTSDRQAWQDGVSGWELELVIKLLLAYLGGSITTQRERGGLTRLTISMPI